MREISCVALDLTTHCDRRCPDCCANIGQRPTVHHDWAYLERAAEFIYGIDRVHITGGEPTVHPQFAEFVPRLKSLFGCKTLTLQTDAFRTDRYRDVLHHFDHIYASRYDERNTRAVDVLVSDFGATTWEGEFTPRARRGGGGVCQRGLLAKNRHVLISVPVGVSEQGAVHGNEFERHRTQFDGDEFNRYSPAVLHQSYCRVYSIAGQMK